MKYLLSLTFFLLLASPVFSQEGTVTAETMFAGAPPAVVELPVPKAKADWSGVISVGIIVNELGSVSLTDDGEGPFPVCKIVTDSRVLAMRAAAVEVAKVAKFSPLVIDGKPQLTSGRLNYRFGTGQHMRLAGLGTVVGTATKNDESGGSTAIGSSGGAAIVVPEGMPKPNMAPGAVLNGSAVSLAKPSYPAAAKAVRAGGSVNVQVLIYDDGTVYSAEAISGHPLLRRSSELAACSSKFTPTLLNGIPVKVSGIVTYNFVP
ncbi:MAG: energy transducer TonB [Pyrinomonadaceae bacterium]